MPPIIVPMGVVPIPVAVPIPIAVLIPIAVTVAVMTMTVTVTGKSRRRDQQRGSRSGNQEESANQGISSEVIVGGVAKLANVTFDE